MSATLPRADEINRSFQYVPELRSRYAEYPMKRTRWLEPHPTDRAPDGGPAFVPVPPEHKPDKPRVRYDTVPLRDGYVFGPGPGGFGYYHLLTRQAYVILTPRLQAESAPTVGCGCLGRGSGEGDDAERKASLRRVCVVLHRRSKSPVPDDVEAVKHGTERLYEEFYH